MSERLTFVALNVSDLDRSLHFYRDLIGLPLSSEAHDEELNDKWYGGAHGAHSWVEGAFLHFAIYPSRLPERPVTTSAQIGFHTDAFEAVHARVANAGVSIAQAPRDEPWGRTARYLDPDGNIVSITASGR